MRQTKFNGSDAYTIQMLYYMDKWSQERLARHYGVSIGTIRRVVLGIGYPAWTGPEAPRADVPRTRAVHEAHVSQKVAPAPQALPDDDINHVNDESRELTMGMTNREIREALQALDAWDPADTDPRGTLEMLRFQAQLDGARGEG